MAESNQKFLEETGLQRQEIYLSKTEKEKLTKWGKKNSITGVKAVCESIIRDFIKSKKLRT